MLQQEELNALNDQIGDKFFASLKKVLEISNNAKLLVRSTSAQQVGLDIMDKMTDLMDAAYDRLTAFAQKEIQTYAGAASEPSKELTTSLEMLGKERPSLMKYCVDEMEKVRRQAIVASFVKALTVGSPEGMPGPMDSSSSDYVRYVGDMLAWCHQTIASETELVQGVFGEASKERTKSVVGG